MSLGTAFAAFFKIAFNKDAALLWQSANSGKLLPEAKLKEVELAAEKNLQALNSARTQLQELQNNLKKLETQTHKPVDGADAVYTLTLLQREGRLIDFLQENISSFDDAQIGAAVRQVHEGCKKALDKHFSISPIVNSMEGETVEVPKNFDPSEFELSGKISGEPPYRGELKHKGWKATAINLPTRQKTHNASVINPAEVEL